MQADRVIATDVQTSMHLTETCKGVDQRLQQIADEISQRRKKSSSAQVRCVINCMLCMGGMPARRHALLAKAALCLPHKPKADLVSTVSPLTSKALSC